MSVRSLLPVLVARAHPWLGGRADEDDRDARCEKLRSGDLFGRGERRGEAYARARGSALRKRPAAEARGEKTGG